jgi:hypothetical protein
LGSSDVEARNAARRELSVATAGEASSLLDLAAGTAGGFLLPLTLLPPAMPLGSERQSELGLWNLQQNQSNDSRVSDWIGQEHGRTLRTGDERKGKFSYLCQNSEPEKSPRSQTAKNFRLNRPFRDLCGGISTERERKFRTKSCNI